MFGRIQQRLGRNTAHIETGAAKCGTFVDARHGHAQLGRPNRTNIPAGASADHNQVKF